MSSGIIKGESDATRIKQQTLSGFLTFYVGVMKSPKLNWAAPVFYDLTAGNGLPDEQTQSPPSPVLLSQAARSLDAPFTAFEKDDRNAATLAQVACGEFEVVHDDFTVAWPRKITEHCSHGRNAGLVYIDPNGVFDDELVANVINKHPTLDLLVNVGATGYKRAGLSGALLGFVNAIQRRTKWIRAPYQCQQWCMLYFSNGPFGGWSSMGWRNIKSEQGARTLSQAAYTKKEYRECIQHMLNIYEQPDSGNQSASPQDAAAAGVKAVGYRSGSIHTTSNIAGGETTTRPNIS